jgi:hypothetical protein
MRHAHPSVAAAELADSLPPQWAQWLRRARADPPRADELREDVARRQRLRLLLERRADEEERRRLGPGAVATEAARAVEGLPPGTGTPPAAEPEGAALARAARTAGVDAAAPPRTAGTAAARTSTVVSPAAPSPWAAVDAAAARRKNPGDDGPEAWKPQAKPRR